MGKSFIFLVALFLFFFNCREIDHHKPKIEGKVNLIGQVNCDSIYVGIYNEPFHDHEFFGNARQMKVL